MAPVVGPTRHGLKVGEGVVPPVPVPMVDDMTRRNRAMSRRPDVTMEKPTTTGPRRLEVAIVVPVVAFPTEDDALSDDRSWHRASVSDVWTSPKGTNPRPVTYTGCPTVPLSVYPSLVLTPMVGATPV